MKTMENMKQVKTKIQTKMKKHQRRICSCPFFVASLVAVLLVGLGIAYKDDYYWIDLEWSFDFTISRFYVMFGASTTVVFALIISSFWWFRRGVCLFLLSFFFS